MPSMARGTDAPPAAGEAWELLTQLFIADKPRRAAMLQELGLSPMQAFALMRLEAGVPQTMGALAEAMQCDNSNVTGIADRLEAARLVERRPAPHDRRVKTLLLTAEGERIRAEARRRMSIPPAGVASLAAADAEALRAILRRALGS